MVAVQPLDLAIGLQTDERPVQRFVREPEINGEFL